MLNSIIEDAVIENDVVDQLDKLERSLQHCGLIRDVRACAVLTADRS